MMSKLAAHRRWCEVGMVCIGLVLGLSVDVGLVWASSCMGSGINQGRWTVAKRFCNECLRWWWAALAASVVGGIVGLTDGQPGMGGWVERAWGARCLL